MDSDKAMRDRLKQRGMPVSKSIGPLRDIRWAASGDDWYIETEEGQVYWYSGKEWKRCPQGAIQ